MENLTKLLGHEESFKRTAHRTGTSRHSRFGTTISVMDVCLGMHFVGSLDAVLIQIKQGANRYILHKQKAVSNSVGGVIDSLKRRKAVYYGHKKQRDELGSGIELTVEAMVVLQEYATECLAVFDGMSNREGGYVKNKVRSLYHQQHSSPRF